jgi:DNA-binding HxlR family transcriptional regulator
MSFHSEHYVRNVRYVRIQPQERRILYVTHTNVPSSRELKLSQIDPASDCHALGQIIDRIADKWAIMIVGHLSQGETLRFNELMRAIPGVSHRMLTLTLRALQRDGIVRRIAHATIPPRVDYALTPLGMSLTKPLQILAGWASENRATIEDARLSYDAEEGHGSHALDAVASPSR